MLIYIVCAIKYEKNYVNVHKQGSCAPTVDRREISPVSYQIYCISAIIGKYRNGYKTRIGGPDENHKIYRNHNKSNNAPRYLIFCALFYCRRQNFVLFLAFLVIIILTYSGCFEIRYCQHLLQIHTHK